MSRSYWLPPDDNGKDHTFTHLTGKLGGYKVLFGLSDDDVASAVADATFFHYTLSAQQAFTLYAQMLTGYKNFARNGNIASLGAFPTPPVLGPAPAMVAPGIVKRFTDLVAHIKTHKHYTETIGKDLLIEGSESQAADPATFKPVLAVKQTGQGVVIGWPKQGMDGLEMQVDRSDGKGLGFLAQDSNPDYTDTAPLPPPGQTALWKYRGIYIQNGERVGLWSDIVSIPVTG